MKDWLHNQSYIFVQSFGQIPGDIRLVRRTTRVKLRRMEWNSKKWEVVANPWSGVTEGGSQY